MSAKAKAQALEALIEAHATELKPDEKRRHVLGGARPRRGTVPSPQKRGSRGNGSGNGSGMGGGS